jgi:uncharacterized protein (TIGR03790 family)
MMKAWLFLGLLTCAIGRGVEPGSEVIVLYNTRVPESKNVALYYAEQRRVPREQIFGFKLSTDENMTREEFRESLQKPLAAQLESKKLWHIAPLRGPSTNNESGRIVSKVVRSRIRYAVLAYGMPLRILSDPNLKEAGAESRQPELRRNEAAVDTELAILPAIEQKLPLTGALRNPIYAATNLAWFHPSNGVLIVSRLDGPSASIARGLVDKAIEAEKVGLWGRAYFDMRKITEPAYKVGDDMLRNAAEICRRLGFETLVDEELGTFPAAFPMSHIAFYAGWYTEHVDGPFAQPKVEFMPGAFAYHIHSYNANTLRSTNRHWVGPLLAAGVTTTMGTIDEPYLTTTPDIGVFASRFLVGGFTFGEAAYASQPVLSWQTTIVGDPLYRAFRKPADEMARELEQEKSLLVEWCYLRLINSHQANGRPIADLINLLERIPGLTNSAVLLEKLGDLYATQGKPASAIHADQQALNRDPSPQQKVRLRLALGERLLAHNEDSEAYQNYKTLLVECPNYPDKPVIYRKLLSLAQKLNKQSDAEHYQAELSK